jgi:hypothetical protein
LPSGTPLLSTYKTEMVQNTTSIGSERLYEDWFGIPTPI